MIIVDIDNTLADNSHRYKLATKKDGSIDWDILYDYDNIITDKPIQYIIDSIQIHKTLKYKIVLFTSRPERIRKATEDWLKTHNVPYNELYMRSEEDHYIKDTELKLKMYNQFVNEKVLFAIDDKKEIVDIWKSLGIPCYKVDSIEYHTDLLLKDKTFHSPSSLEELGYIYFGPLIFNYLCWLKNELIACDKVLFNSREGYFLQELYDLCKDKWKLPKSEYFKTSRRLSTIISIKTKQDIYDTFKLHRYSGTLNDLLEYRFGIKLNEDKNILIDTSVELPNLEPYISDILNNSKRVRMEYQKYIEQIIGESKNVTMIDSGYQGTTQFNIEKTYNLKFKGRYLLYKKTLPLNDVKGFYRFENGTLKDNIIFLESVFTDKVGSYVDIINGEFINEESSENQKYFDDKIKIINGIKEFINQMLNLNIDLNNPSNIKPEYFFNLMCKKDFIKNDSLFYSFFHDNHYTRNEIKKLKRF